MRNDTNHTVDGRLRTMIVNESTTSYNISELGKCYFEHNILNKV